MKHLSKKEIALILTPIITGVLFIATVFLNHALFDNQIITARKAIGSEMFFFLIGFITTIIQLPFIIKWLYKKQWKLASLCILSSVVFWSSIMFGGSQGAAIFHAT